MSNNVRKYKNQPFTASRELGPIPATIRLIIKRAEFKSSALTKMMKMGNRIKNEMQQQLA
jgi:hypothetical protein